MIEKRVCQAVGTQEHSVDKYVKRTVSHSPEGLSEERPAQGREPYISRFPLGLANFFVRIRQQLLELCVNR